MHYQSDFNDRIVHLNDVVADRRQRIENALSQLNAEPAQVTALKELIAEFGDFAMELGKMHGQRDRSPKKESSPAFSSDPRAPEVFPHNGRWYINLGRPGCNTQMNNSIGYTTEDEALKVTRWYNKK